MARIVAEDLETGSCGSALHPQERVHQGIYWCRRCQIPLLAQEECPLCHSRTHRSASDLKPVFVPERKRFESLVQRSLPTFLFVNDNRVYFNGQTLFSFRAHPHQGLHLLKNHLGELDEHRLTVYTGDYSRQQWELCLLANLPVLAALESEAIEFIRSQADRFADRRPISSFSGGKDSAVTALLVRDALGNTPLLFGDTSIEFPVTQEHILSFAQAYGFDLYSEEPDADFFSLCGVLGPPSRIMRWCCTVCKSRPINKFYAGFADRVLSFDGIRRMESNSRGNYPRVAHVQKFSRQVVARPILEWSSFAVWLYILEHGISYNPLYDLGYSRVGCIYCPSNSPYNDLLTRENFPELYNRWTSYLIDYARAKGKADPEGYVFDGFWKRRKIGKERTFVVDRTQPCGLGTQAVYEFASPVCSELLEFLKPFGLVHTIGSEESCAFAINSMHPFTITGVLGGTQLAVAFENGHTYLPRLRIEKQIEKYLNCVHCGGCVGVCPNGAISIRGARYHVDEARCTHCGRCVTTKYLKEGCVALNFAAEKNAVRRE